jgi:hypothetical protein
LPSRVDGVFAFASLLQTFILALWSGGVEPQALKKAIVITSNKHLNIIISGLTKL